MNAPVVTEGIGFVTYTWSDLGLRVLAERYDTDGHADLSFFSYDGTDEVLLDQNTINLKSVTSKNAQAKRLEKNRKDISWDDVLVCVAHLTLNRARQGEPVQEIWPNESDNLVPEYLLEPILYVNHPAVIFGDYGSHKSLLALMIGYVAQLPHVHNNLGLITQSESAPCLYLDYEDDPSSFRKRWGAIQRGFNIEAPIPMLYQRMTRTLSDSVDIVQEIIAKEKAKLLIVDSLGPAARGNLNDPEPAIKYHEALRKLRTTSLTLAHNSKDPLTKKRTIFGSVFFTNLARSVWECKAEMEAGESESIVSLKHTKANLSKLHPTLGYRFTFTDNSITVARADLKDTGLSGELPLRWQIKNLLREGPQTTQNLAGQLDSKADTIGRTLRRMRKDNQVVRLEGDTWGLAL